MGLSNDCTNTAIRSEDDFLTLVDEYFPAQHSHMLLGRGDDCAELACPPKICMTSDLFLEDIHFRTSYFSYFEIGHKSLAVNISDIAAAGAKPLGFNMNLMLPKHTSRTDVAELLRGMSSLAQEFDLPLTGGDLSQSPKLGVCITIWGEKSGPDFLRRGNCKPGDTIFVMGQDKPLGLGLARTGLLALEEWGREQAMAKFPAACRAHLLPQPLPLIGQSLANLGIQVATMDLSDGLARDLPRLLGQGEQVLSANLTLHAQDLHPELLAYCALKNIDPLPMAVLGGEEYLLIAASSQTDLAKKITTQTGATVLAIGHATTGPDIMLNNSPWHSKGFDHFQLLKQQ